MTVELQVDWETRPTIQREAISTKKQ